MGTDIIPIANHSVSFNKRSYSTIAKEVKSVLDREKTNIIHLYHLATGESENDLFQEDWKFYRFFDPHEPYRKLEFYLGTFEFFDIDKYKLLFSWQVYRYRQWLEMPDEIRNKARDLFFYIANLFGGDRIIYLADDSHPLDKYAYENVPFYEIEKMLQKDFGAPKANLKEVEKNYLNSYFIEHF